MHSRNRVIDSLFILPEENTQKKHATLLLATHTHTHTYYRYSAARVCAQFVYTRRRRRRRFAFCRAIGLFASGVCLARLPHLRHPTRANIDRTRNAHAPMVLRAHTSRIGAVRGRRDAHSRWMYHTLRTIVKCVRQYCSQETATTTRTPVLPHRAMRNSSRDIYGSSTYTNH